MSAKEKILSEFSPFCSHKGIDFDALIASLRQIQFSQQDIRELMSPDPAHPYGRKVLISHPEIEIMVATWSPNWPCAPHDHGNSNSAIRVLQGTSNHLGYTINNGQLAVSFQEVRQRNEIILCGPMQVHSMGSTGDELLLTLHCYAKSIDDMIIYDQKKRETIIVNGKAGAWLPVDDCSHIITRRNGFWKRDELVNNSQNQENLGSLDFSRSVSL